MNKAKGNDRKAYNRFGQAFRDSWNGYAKHPEKRDIHTATLTRLLSAWPQVWAEHSPKGGRALFLKQHPLRAALVDGPVVTLLGTTIVVPLPTGM